MARTTVTLERAYADYLDARRVAHLAREQCPHWYQPACAGEPCCQHVKQAEDRQRRLHEHLVRVRRQAK